MKKIKMCIYKKGADCIQDMVSVNSDYLVYSGEKVSEYLERKGPEYNLVSLQYACEKIEEENTKQYINPWVEIKRGEYWEMLEVLPPENWVIRAGFEAFRMMEYTTSNITGHYVRIGSRYFTADRRNTQDYISMLNEIEKQFDL